MITRVWDYEVAPANRSLFESAYGAQGGWASLFARSPGFVGTELFVSLSRPAHYLTVDTFTDRAAWEEFLQQHRGAYDELDRATEALTLEERRLCGP